MTESTETESTETETETETGPLDNAKLNFALDVVMARERLTAKEVARRAGIYPPQMTHLRKYGKAGGVVQLRILAFLNMKPAPFQMDTTPAEPATEPAAA